MGRVNPRWDAPTGQGMRQQKQSSHQPKQGTPQPKQGTPQTKEGTHHPKQGTHQPKQGTHQPKQGTHQMKQGMHQPKQGTHQPKVLTLVGPKTRTYHGLVGLGRRTVGRRGGTMPGMRGHPRTVSPRRQPSLAPSKASYKPVLIVSSEARPKQIPFKPVEEQKPRLTRV